MICFFFFFLDNAHMRIVMSRSQRKHTRWRKKLGTDIKAHQVTSWWWAWEIVGTRSASGCAIKMRASDSSILRWCYVLELYFQSSLALPWGKYSRCGEPEFHWSLHSTNGKWSHVSWWQLWSLERWFARQIIEVFLFFAQWWTVIHFSRFVKIHVGHSELFNDGICIGGWFSIHSRNLSLMTTVNHRPIFPALIPPSSILSRRSCAALSSVLDNVHTWDCSLANVPRDVLVLMFTLEIVLANILRDVSLLLNVAGCISMQ